MTHTRTGVIVRRRAQAASNWRRRQEAILESVAGHARTRQTTITCQAGRQTRQTSDIHSVVVGSSRTETRCSALDSVRRTKDTVGGERPRAGEAGVCAESTKAVESGIHVARTAKTAVSAAREIPAGIVVAGGARGRRRDAGEAGGSTRQTDLCTSIVIACITGTCPSGRREGPQGSRIARGAAGGSGVSASETGVRTGNAKVVEVVQSQPADAGRPHQISAQG